MSSGTTRSGVADQVCGIVAGIMGVHPADVSETASPDSLRSWDSLRHMKLILAVEETFGVRLTDEEIVSITDVRSIVALVERKRGVEA